MCPLRFISLLLALVLINFKQTQAESNEICDFSDSDCLLKGSRNIYKALVAGVEGDIDPIDPMHVDKISSDYDALEYQRINVTLTGLRNCEVALLKFSKNKVSYEYRLQCPQLVLDYNFEVHGKLVDLELNAKGRATFTADDYELIIKGVMEIYISEVDKQPRMSLKNYELDTNPKGKLTYKGELTQGDKAQLALMTTYIENNQKYVKEHLRTDVLTKFIAILVKSVDTYAKTYPLHKIFPKQ